MIEKLGASPLFLGVETVHWTLPDFENAAHNAKSLGCTSLLVKIADGGNLWYGDIGGWQKVLDTIQAIISAVPYTYCYGDKFGGIHTEISILTEAMQHSGIVVADLETEMNGQAGWAKTYCDALKGVSGIFGVTTWADPQLQNWHEVLAALAPCVNFWLPQVYSDFLASTYHTQFDPYGLPYYPVLNLGADAGPNDMVAIAKASNSDTVAFWEYGPAIGAYASTVKLITSTLHPTASTSTSGDTSMDIHDPFATEHFQEKDANTWYCIQTRQSIIGAILKYFKKIWGAPRLPRSGEMTDIAGIKWQWFECGVIIYDPSHVHDHPTDDDCYLAKLDDPIVLKLLQSQLTQSATSLSANAQTALDALLANFALMKQTAAQVGQDIAALEHGADTAAVTIANIKAALH